jgi:Glycosyl transferase family 2
MTRFASFSIVVLTHDRPEEVLRLARELRKFSSRGAEIIIVDNASPRPVRDLIDHDEFTILRLPTNEGAVGRNHGIRKAARDIVITLDDDLFGLTDETFEILERRFSQEPATGAICFRVLSSKPPHPQINWCHHYRIEAFADRRFVTDEISEGAVAFRRTALEETALYPEEFFISHEGVALARGRHLSRDRPEGAPVGSALLLRYPQRALGCGALHARRPRADAAPGRSVQHVRVRSAGPAPPGLATRSPGRSAGIAPATCKATQPRSDDTANLEIHRSIPPQRALHAQEAPVSVRCRDLGCNRAALRGPRRHRRTRAERPSTPSSRQPAASR